MNYTHIHVLVCKYKFLTESSSMVSNRHLGIHSTNGDIIKMIILNWVDIKLTHLENYKSQPEKFKIKIEIGSCAFIDNA